MTATKRKHVKGVLTTPRLDAARQPQQGAAANERQRAREIFIVLATTMYEGSDPVRSFASREAADSFAQRCREHEAMRINSPGLDAPEHEWDSWSEKNRMWELTHPAAPLSGRESYDVMPITFDPS
ncbi:hypothetical protein [Burkholderia ambifaria]|uniref:hypothetical protein n=1 Tax=Burkholderia ambifaria TaxID=152480 RepID=UPI00158FC816|nr:hypothetical protein [Burkholderia ambifaria]